MVEATQAPAEPRLPRVTIQFCTQCKWMLRAAYYAQELLSTFSVSLGEVALQPATGGVFVVEITTVASNDSSSGNDNSTSTRPSTNPDQPATQKKVVLWDRKVDGGFPETKELKRRVRDVIQPGRDLGHVDRDYARGKGGGDGAGVVVKAEAEVEAGRAEGAKKSESAAGEESKGEGKTCSVEGGGKCEDCE